MTELNRSRPATTEEVQDMTVAQRAFLDAVHGERARQDRKWGRNFVAIDRMVVVLGEEFGEVCRAHLENRDAPGELEHLLEELVQTAAVCAKTYELLRAGSR